MKHYYVATCPPPYNYVLICKDSDLVGYNPFIYKQFGSDNVMNFMSIEEAVEHFSTSIRNNAITGSFYYKPSSLTDFDITLNDCKPVYSITDNNPEFFI